MVNTTICCLTESQISRLIPLKLQSSPDQLSVAQLSLSQFSMETGSRGNRQLGSEGHKIHLYLKKSLDRTKLAFPPPASSLYAKLSCCRHESGISCLVFLLARKQISIFAKMSNYSFLNHLHALLLSHILPLRTPNSSTNVLYRE